MKAADVADGHSHGVTVTEAAELRELRKRNCLLEQENEILRRGGVLRQGDPPKMTYPLVRELAADGIPVAVDLPGVEVLPPGLRGCPWWSRLSAGQGGPERQLGRACAAWLKLVHQFETGGPWDHKSLLRPVFFAGEDDDTKLFSVVPGNDQVIKYDVWSNIHYGYIGTKLGFDESALIFFQSETAKKISLGKTGDGDPGDDYPVRVGIELARSGDQMTRSDLDQVIRKNLSEPWLAKVRVAQ